MSYFLIIRGPLGVGKSTVAARVTQAVGGEHIRIDRILEERRLEDDWEDGYISQRSFLRANRFAIEEAEPALSAGRPVVIDGNFYWPSALEDLTLRLAYPHFVFTLKAPLEVCIARDRGRPAPAVGRDPVAEESQGEEGARAVYEKTLAFEAGMPIDASRSLDAVVADILVHLPRTQP